MTHYLLSIYQPDGDPPPPAVLDKVMRDVDALVQELKTTGAWVFNGGLHAPSTAAKAIGLPIEVRPFQDAARTD